MTIKSNLKCGILIPICFLLLTVFVPNPVSSKTVNEKKTKESPRYCIINFQCSSDENCENYKCEERERSDDGLGLGIYITIGVGIALAIPIGTVFCCVCCPCCPLNKRRKQNFVSHQPVALFRNEQAIMDYDEQGLPSLPVIYDPNQLAYGAPMNGINGHGYAQQQFQGHSASTYPVQPQTQAPGWAPPSAFRQ